MKTLCISGAACSEFDHISDLLFAAGLEHAKPVEREAIIGMAEWHQNTATALAQQKLPGRLWEQLAGDLLLANVHHPQWGWADTKSTVALEFWAEFEPNISFLLLTCDPEDYLAQSLLSDTNEQAKEEPAYLKQWQNEHEKLLEFYLTHAERCLLVDAAQALSNPKALIEKLNERLQFNLNATQALLPALPRNSMQAAPATLARYIAGQALQDHGKQLLPLTIELHAAQEPLAKYETAEDTEGNVFSTAEISLASLLKDYQRRCEHDLSESERLVLKKLKQENAKLLAQLQKVQQQLEYAEKQQQLLKDEVKEAKMLPTQQHQQVATELAKIQQENELLLIQLHQVQEEIETTFLRNQQNKKALNEATEQVSNLTKENGQFSQLLQEQRTNYKNSQKENELLLIQLHQVQEELEYYFLQNQKASDEALQLKQENRKIKQQYSLAKEQALAPKGLFVRKSKKAVPLLLFEDVQLLREHVNPDYEHLWITLQSPIFGDKHVEQWDFRISCAGVKPGEFGKQPKLELPEQKDQLFTKWFAESESEHGRKLELRFALPNAMDTGVWKQISPDDQQLIKSLLEQLPGIISELKNKNNYIHRNWSDWETLVANMQRISKAKTSK